MISVACGRLSAGFSSLSIASPLTAFYCFRGVYGRQEFASRAAGYLEESLDE
jgi:hypothetical protein